MNSVPLSWKRLAHYVREVQEVEHGLLRRLEDLEAASATWIEHDVSADRLLEDESKLDREAWHRTMVGVDASQIRFFDALEGFLSGWARLSLLFFPARGKSATEAHRVERAALLREQLNVPNDSLIADRDLRNAWAHMDERIDQLMVIDRFKDRQRFVHSRETPDFLGQVPRLMEVDTLTVHYVTDRGETRSVNLRELRRVLLDLEQRIREWWRRPPAR